MPAGNPPDREAELVIIDTAPHFESAALAAARLADLVPCRPSLLDLKAITTTIDLAALAKTPALAVLNTVPVRGELKGEAEQVLRSYGVEMAPVTLGHRVFLFHCTHSECGKGSRKGLPLQ